MVSGTGSDEIDFIPIAKRLQSGLVNFLACKGRRPEISRTNSTLTLNFGKEYSFSFSFHEATRAKEDNLEYLNEPKENGYSREPWKTIIIEYKASRGSHKVSGKRDAGKDPVKIYAKDIYEKIISPTLRSI